MPTLKSKDRVTRGEDEYASDDGFVVNDYDDEPQKGKLKRKRQKLDKPAAKRTKHNGDPASGDGERDEEGGIYWELSKNRRVTISEYKGKRMVHIREYYSKDDKMLPGKKGITLPIDQFSALVKTLPKIERALVDLGEEVPRPEYDYSNEGQAEHAFRGEEAAAEERKNFDPTSDEGE